MKMPCERFVNTIQELADGTLGPIRRAELDLHLDQCEDCRRFADDVVRIRDAAASLDRPAPPDRVWLQIAGQLRNQGRVAAPPPLLIRSWRYAPLAIAASLLLVVSASWFVLYQGSRQIGTQPGPGNAATRDAVQGVESEFRLAEQHYQNAIAKLEEAFRNDNDAIDAQTAAMLKKNLEVIDQAIAESRAALRSEPQSTAALGSLFDALKRKVIVLQDTIALMNQMRKGDAAGAAQLVDSVNKS
jgi:hypothetical protein